MRKLKCDEARKLSIVDYLAQYGFCPQYIKEGNHWYFSPILQQHAAAKLYIDHDKAAAKTVTFIKQIIPNAEDASHFYSGYKDLNVYLKIQQQQSRGLSL
ncbi:hypothetical protein HDF19_20335 [Mucilaginibacter sp. E4BP6]|uniref:hypothetical protein n=1 Tax=Mucilaginibacter sp. E4BP6 TaxID=2723089 RepID=UPI0015CCC48B|nr:hypothetical protein [Mucilaginibacter sp. E4BP6]NYE67345.1 hypothetical protein [Mucilaginibacter sp. E4BP6]